MFKNDFQVNDNVTLLDGRRGLIIEQDKNNPYYYKVETLDCNGNKTYFKMFYKDMRKFTIV